MPAPPDEFRDALILTGPTGSGKTALAVDWAEEIGAEIIALDSMTLYRGLDVGTAKPTAKERARVPHHLIDVLDPWESASVAWYLDRAAACVRDIRTRGKQPMFVGGTPFYLKALLFGLFDAPPADETIRAGLETEATRHGAEALHARLAALDPVTAARLHPNDVRRVVRALEVFERTGRPISALQSQWVTAGPDPATGVRDSMTVFCLDLPRDELYDRINRRVDIMVSAGWLDEVRRLRALPRPVSREASRALGYRELAAVLDRTADLPGAVEQIKTRSRQFAKRQLTWFRHLPGLQFVPPELTLLSRASRIK